MTDINSKTRGISQRCHFTKWVMDVKQPPTPYELYIVYK